MKGNPLSTTQRRRQHTQRLAWLSGEAQASLLARLPSISEDVEAGASDALDEAVRRMMHLRLYAPTSTKASVRHSIRLLVAELRGTPHREWARK